jgi:hypothetical protein
VPPVLQAHSRMCACTPLRNESPGGSCGEESCSDRTRHAGSRRVAESNTLKGPPPFQLEVADCDIKSFCLMGIAADPRAAVAARERGLCFWRSRVTR